MPREMGKDGGNTVRESEGRSDVVQKTEVDEEMTLGMVDKRKCSLGVNI